MSPSQRYSGKRVLFGLALLVISVVALLVVWAQATPSVPDARERMRGQGLPGVEASQR